MPRRPGLVRFIERRTRHAHSVLVRKTKSINDHRPDLFWPIIVVEFILQQQCGKGLFVDLLECVGKFLQSHDASPRSLLNDALHLGRGPASAADGTIVKYLPASHQSTPAPSRGEIIRHGQLPAPASYQLA